MTDRRFYLWPRGKKGIFYASLLDPKTGAMLVPRSTGTNDRIKAEATAYKWAYDGIPSSKAGQKRTVEEQADLQSILRAIPKAGLDASGAMQIVLKLKALDLIDIPAVPKSKGKETFIQALLTFWDYETSPYVKDRINHGQKMTIRHCNYSVQNVKKHWGPYFTDRQTMSITRQDIKDFGYHLQKQGLAANTINSIMTKGETAFLYWFKEGLIPVNPADGIRRFAGQEKKRGVLIMEEAEALFSRKWKNRTAYIGNLVSCTCGLREGEVQAIRKEDIGEKYLKVSHSWNDQDGLKAPKNGEARRVPLMPEVRGLLLEQLKSNPHTDIENPFVFWSRLANKPQDGKFLLISLHEELEAIGIDWKGRNIVFHSNRHFYATQMAKTDDLAKIQRVLGHKTPEMTDHYADHIEEQELDEIGTAMRFKFKGLVNKAG